MASIVRIKSGWRVFVFRNGARATKVLPTRREAQDWGREKESELSALTGTGGHEFGMLAKRYVEQVTPRKRSVTWEKNVIRRLTEEFGRHTRLADIDAPEISAWRDRRLLTVKASSWIREANLLRNMFTVARDEWRWIDHNPFRGVRIPQPGPPRDALWTWQEIRRILRAPCSGKTAEAQLAFHISLHTGMRLKEVLNATWDVEKSIALIPESKTSTTKVQVPLTSRVLKLLPASFTLSPNEASVLFSELRSSLLIEGVTFHDARAFALTMLARRVDVMTLARISRHKDLRVLLATYYRESAEDIAKRLRDKRSSANRSIQT